MAPVRSAATTPLWLGAESRPIADRCAQIKVPEEDLSAECIGATDVVFIAVPPPPKKKSWPVLAPL